MPPDQRDYHGYTRQQTEELVMLREAMGLLRQIENLSREIPLPFREIINSNGDWNREAFMTDALRSGDVFKLSQVSHLLHEVLNSKRALYDSHYRDPNQRKWGR